MTLSHLRSHHDFTTHDARPARDSTTVVIAGRPGAGKGTQAEMLASRFGFAHVSTGDLVRDATSRSTQLRAELESTMAAGGLVPDRTILELLVDELAQLWPTRGVLLDGFPRTLAQARAFETLRSVDLVIELDVPARRIIERLRARGRSDDTIAAIEARLHVYERETRPMLHAFDARGALLTIDGDRAPELVTADLFEAMAVHRPLRRSQAHARRP